MVNNSLLHQKCHEIANKDIIVADDFKYLEKFISESSIDYINSETIYEEYFPGRMAKDNDLGRVYKGSTWGFTDNVDLGIMFYEGPWKYSYAWRHGDTLESMVVRGIPVFNKTDKLSPLSDGVYYHPYYHGPRLTLILSPDRKIMCKSDWQEATFRMSANTSSIYSHLKTAPFFKELERMVHEIGDFYHINIIMYGGEVSFIDTPIYNDGVKFKILSLTERNTHRFTNYNIMNHVCSRFGVPCIERLHSDTDDLIEQTGGVIQAKYEYGEIEYKVKRNEELLDRRKAIIVNLWEQT